MRSCLESDKSRKVERSMMQMDVSFDKAEDTLIT